MLKGRVDNEEIKVSRPVTHTSGHLFSREEITIPLNVFDPERPKLQVSSGKGGDYFPHVVEFPMN